MRVRGCGGWEVMSYKKDIVDALTLDEYERYYSRASLVNMLARYGANPHVSHLNFLAGKAAAALRELEAELLDTTWQDHADHWQKRATELEAERDSALEAYELTRQDCRNLTEKVIPNIRAERDRLREAVARLLPHMEGLAMPSKQADEDEAFARAALQEGE